MPSVVRSLVALWLCALCASCAGASSETRGDADSDHDGVPDARDQCPNVPEDRDGDDDDDGCPEATDRDTDHDGLFDTVDQCPNDAEDRDAFQDEDGCPDPDNDQDRIPDADDHCPNEAEVYNGYEDQDGCPDRGEVVVTEIVDTILERVYFRRNSTVIGPESGPILDALAAAVVGDPDLQLVALVGQASSRERHAVSIAATRARAVADALVARGVERARLSLYAQVLSTDGTRVQEDRARNVWPAVERANDQAVDPPSLRQPGVTRVDAPPAPPAPAPPGTP
jgi:outer membrane protein OmpA-like peptidoglycan-associated protein